MKNLCLAEGAKLEDIKPEGVEEPPVSTPKKRQRMRKKKDTPEEIAAREDEIMRKFHGVFRYHGKVLHLEKRSMYCFDRDFCLRKAFVWFVEWKWFDRFITLVILLNSLLLAFTDY